MVVATTVVVVVMVVLVVAVTEMVVVMVAVADTVEVAVAVLADRELQGPYQEAREGDSRGCSSSDADGRCRCDTDSC